MWSSEQQECLDEITAIFRYAMERKMQGGLGFNLIGNGMVGNKVKCDLFFPITAGESFTDKIVDMDKNITNQLAAEKLKNLLKEV